MSEFELLTKYLPLLKDDEIGKVNIDNDNDGLEEHPLKLPYYQYSDMIMEFMQDVYEVDKAHKNAFMLNYRKMLKQNNIQWGDTSMYNLDGQCLMALIMSTLRAERFCEGVLYMALKNGIMQRWLKRLQELDK